MSIMDKQLETLIIYIYLTMKIAVNYNAVLRKELSRNNLYIFGIYVNICHERV